MSQTKIYPSTQEQVAAVDAKLDIVNSKLPLPIYQAKAATPSDELQIITPDSGYSALSSVSVVPISALMPESLNEYILRTATDYFSLHLSGNIPACACYGQNKLIHVYGNATSIGGSAFYGCSSLQEIDLRNATSIGGNAFQSCSILQLIDLTSRTTPTTLSNTAAFSGTNSTWIAVVANDTIKAAFQSATNWSTFASHFRTIAEVEAEVGMTYDEYYLQIFGHARNEVSA